VDQAQSVAANSALARRGNYARPDISNFTLTNDPKKPVTITTLEVLLAISQLEDFEHPKTVARRLATNLSERF